jgi:hypothetical protein
LVLRLGGIIARSQSETGGARRKHETQIDSSTAGRVDAVEQRTQLLAATIVSPALGWRADTHDCAEEDTTSDVHSHTRLDSHLDGDSYLHEYPNSERHAGAERHLHANPERHAGADQNPKTPAADADSHTRTAHCDTGPRLSFRGG